MKDSILLLAGCIAAASSPLFTRDSPAEPRITFPGWPDRFEERALTATDMSPREKRFAEQFPGRIGIFTAGDRTIILRFVERPTRRLHPASDCFAGAGYSIRPISSVEVNGETWGRFEAERGDEKLLVRERIEAVSGQSWADPSSWYWSALLGASPGPWWATTVVEPATP